MGLTPTIPKCDPCLRGILVETPTRLNSTIKSREDLLLMVGHCCGKDTVIYERYNKKRVNDDGASCNRASDAGGVVAERRVINLPSLSPSHSSKAVDVVVGSS